jgi:hypothetical protein
MRIVKKKVETPTVRKKLITTEEGDEVPVEKGKKKVYITNEQLLMEHMLETQNRLTKLEQKHKKHKKRLNEFIYTLEDEDIPDTIDFRPEVSKPKELSVPAAPLLPEEPKEEPKEEQEEIVHPCRKQKLLDILNTRKDSWLSRIKYIN